MPLSFTEMPARYWLERPILYGQYPKRYVNGFVTKITQPPAPLSDVESPGGLSGAQPDHISSAASGKGIRPRSSGSRKLAEYVSVCGTGAFQDMEGVVSGVHDM